MKEAEAVWAVANLQPATIPELLEVFDDASYPVASTVVIRLYRSGFFVRRMRENDEQGGNPYEYAIASPEAIDD